MLPRHSAPDKDVQMVEAHRAHSHRDVPRTGLRGGDLGVPEDLGAAMNRDDHCAHRRRNRHRKRDRRSKAERYTPRLISDILHPVRVGSFGGAAVENDSNPNTLRIAERRGI